PAAVGVRGPVVSGRPARSARARASGRDLCHHPQVEDFDMHPERALVAAVASRIAERLGAAPELAIVLGSGLGAVTDRAEVRAEATFEDLGLPGSTVPGHAGRLVRATLFGRDV